MSATFLIKRGQPALRGKRHAHVARIGVSGNVIGAWCREKINDEWISSNVPWGLKQCQHCVKAYLAALEMESRR